MAKKLIKKYFSGKRHYREDALISRIFGKVMQRKHLWYINRRSVSVAFGVGIFCAFVPIPLQTLLATVTAILLRANLPIAIASVWITNPLTFTPLYYFCYKVGQQLLALVGNTPYLETDSTLPDMIFSSAWQAFLLGCLSVGMVAALLGYVTINLAWRYYTSINWRYRKKANRRYP